jgi:F-type H+-transporting ATPase subunit delta
VPDSQLHIEVIGTIYAQALINEAQKQNALDEITDDIRGIGGLLRTNDSFRAFAQALAIGEDERLVSLENIFAGRIHELTLNTLRALSRRDRLVFIQGFVDGFEAILKRMAGVVDAALVTAVELRPDAVQRVREALGRSLAKTVDLHMTIDPALVGGITLTIGDTLIDGSVATQLHSLEKQLKQGRIKMESVVAT